MPAELTAVTVVFESEVDLQELQARSLAVHAGDLLERILVLDNTARGMGERRVRRLLDAYGRLAARVEVVRGDDVATVPRSSGWVRQQVLKLLVAGRVPTPRYLVLDAKNHAVAPIAPDYVVAPDGRSRGSAYGYRDHPLRPGLERVLRYLGLDPEDHLDRFPATVTPFVLDVAEVERVVADVERRAGRPFAQEFVDAGLLEFFLYSGSLLAAGRLDDVLALDRAACPVVWPRGADVAGVRRVVAEVADQPFVGVQRKALARMPRAAADELVAFWVERGLFADAAAGRRFVRRFRRRYVVQEVRRKLAERLPGRREGAR